MMVMLTAKRHEWIVGPLIQDTSCSPSRAIRSVRSLSFLSLERKAHQNGTDDGDEMAD